MRPGKRSARSSRRAWIAASALLVFLPLTGIGCAGAALGALIGVLAGSGGGGSSSPNIAPAVSVDGVADNSGNITIDYTISDLESDLASVAVTYRVGAGAASPATPTGSPTTGLATSPVGVAHTFVWDSVRDLGPTNRSGVVIEIQPFDGKGGAADSSPPFDVSNNEPPTVLVLQPSGTQTGTFIIRYLLSDSASDTCSVTPGFSLTGAGGPFQPATADPGHPDHEGVSSLASTPGGELHQFAWDSLADLKTTDIRSVSFRIAANDGIDPGLPDATDVDIRVDNAIDADLVLGQPSFFEGDVSGRGIHPGFLQGDVHVDATRIILQDSINNRVLIWNQIPTSDFQAADVVLGQRDFTVNEENAFGSGDNRSLRVGQALTFDGSRLYLASGAPGRVLVFNSLPTQSAQPADYRISSTGLGNLPVGSADGVWSDGTRLAISDWIYNRVLLYDTLPLADGTVPDTVLGQPDLVSNASGTSASAMNRPKQVTYDVGTDQLFVVDSNNHRIMVWDDWPVTNNAPCDWVIGQPDKTSGSFNQGGGAGATTLGNPVDVHADTGPGGLLWVTDRGGSRVLGYTRPVAQDGKPASRVLGQVNFTDASANNDPVTGAQSAATLDDPSSVHVGGGKMAVVDSSNNRVLIWDPVPTANGQAADLILGQPDAVAPWNEPDHQIVDPADFRDPEEAISDGTRLFVADTENHRVLIWNILPTVDFKGADLVLGQTDFESSEDRVNTASGIWQPRGLATDGTRLYAVAAAHHRVMVWLNVPVVSNQPCDLVLGQASPTSFAGAGLGAARLSLPFDVATDGSHVAVADLGNDRVLVWFTPPVSDQEPPDAVLGQADFTSADSTVLQSPQSLAITPTRVLVGSVGGIKIWNRPLAAGANETPDLVLDQFFSLVGGMYVDSAGRFFASDTRRHIVYFWSSEPTVASTPPDGLLGQPDFTTFTANTGGISPRSLNLGISGGATSRSGLGGYTAGADHLLVADSRNGRVLRFTFP